MPIAGLFLFPGYAYFVRIFVVKRRQVFNNESEFETYIRGIIRDRITSEHPHVYALANKKAVDILICRDGEEPSVFFLEVKYHKHRHGRLGFGSRGGDGFQLEIVSLGPAYFESNLRWVLASEFDEPGKLLFLPSSTIRRYVAGGSVGPKFNNIQARIFKKESFLGEDEFVSELKKWLNCAIGA